MKKLVWLNVETGKFSNCWTEKQYENNPYCSKNELIKSANEKGNQWKLIEFECLTDENFEFSHTMKIK